VLRTLDTLARPSPTAVPNPGSPLAAGTRSSSAGSRDRRRPRLRALDGGVHAPSIRPTPA
jgi:hypothetical protein